MEQFNVTYEDQFKRYLLVAKSMVKMLKGKQDRDTCIPWIQRIASLKPSCAPVARDRNLFFQYLIGVIQQTFIEDLTRDDPDYASNNLQQSPIEGLHVVQDPAWLNEELNIPPLILTHNKRNAPYFAHWSKDQKIYLAVKGLPGQGVLLYLAVSKDTSQGWSNLSECEGLEMQ